jgi:hypothetical protein
MLLPVVSLATALHVGQLAGSCALPDIEYLRPLFNFGRADLLDVRNVLYVSGLLVAVDK